MLYGKGENNEKIRATPGIKAKCPECDMLLISRCGEINIWHFAHRVKSDCIWKDETVWHLRWKLLVAKEFCEIKIGNHRADIVGRDGLIIELQHSSISPATIKEREISYKKMIWVIDATDFIDRFFTHIQPTHVNFHWKHIRKCWTYSQKQLFLDFGEQYDSIKATRQEMLLRDPRYLFGVTTIDGIPIGVRVTDGMPERLFEIKKIYKNGNGWGHFVSFENFKKLYFPEPIVQPALFTIPQNQRSVGRAGHDDIL